jgi:hypothetical protein
MPLFRKKPIVIEAVRWNLPGDDNAAGLAKDAGHPDVRGTSYGEIARMLGTSGCSRSDPYWDWSVMGIIDNFEGPHVVEPGDWIITGVKGERYPIKADIFAATYEPAGDSSTP